METEFGSSQPIRLANVSICDGNGNVMLCECGQPAGSGAIGKEAYILWCEDCSPYKDIPVAKFAYRSPNE